MIISHWAKKFLHFWIHSYKRPRKLDSLIKGQCGHYSAGAYVKVNACQDMLFKTGMVQKDQ